MYEYFRGTLALAGNNFAVVDCHGVGYRLGISLNSFAKLPDIGHDVQLFSHYHVTENSQALYGFYTADEREVFESLVAVNGIGPKVALAVLSTLTVEQIVSAVEQQNSAAFKACSGVGPKTAQRMILELKGKINITVAAGARTVRTTEKPAEQSVRDEAYTALIALGYNESQVRVALAKIAEQLDESDTVQNWITTALRVV